jgi:hypothetical protein
MQQTDSFHLIQILLPLTTNSGLEQPQELFREFESDLIERYGGLTAYIQSPAQGHWKDGDDRTSKDQIVVFEVMARVLDASWWSARRQQAEKDFGQSQIVIRATKVVLL